MKGLQVEQNQSVKIRPFLHQNNNIANTIHNIQVLSSLNSSSDFLIDMKKRGRPKKV